MAGVVRQPIDVARLEAYIQNNVTEIKIPIDVKQVRVNALPIIMPVLAK
jgi:hypothetical protein